MSTMTLEQAQVQREAQIEGNRECGVFDYKTREKKSESVYEVIDGYTHLPDGKGGTRRLGPGQRFHPTEKQVRQGSLKGKARELSRSEYSALKGGSKAFAGADFKEMEEKSGRRRAAAPKPDA